MTGGEREEQFTLPPDVLKGVLEQVDPCATFARSVIEEGNAVADSVRKQLERQGSLRTLSGESEACVSDIDGVDGSYSIVQAAGFSIAVISAVRVGKELRHRELVVPTIHSEYLTTAVQGLMTAMELAMCSISDEALVLYDGSFLSALVRLNALLGAREEHESDGVWTAFDEHLRNLVLGSSWFYLALSSGKVIGWPKLSTSTEIVDLQFPNLKGRFTDRSLLSLVLNPGEFVVNIRRLPQANLGRKSRFRPSDARDVEEFFTNEGITEVFFRPKPWTPAYKLEFPGNWDLHKIDRVLRTCCALFLDPSLFEPYPQFLADCISRQIGSAAGALHEAIQSVLYQDGFRVQDVRAISRMYRTT